MGARLRGQGEPSPPAPLPEGEGGLALPRRLGSRFRGNDVVPGDIGDGAQRAPSWRYRADWIPAYAGMTAKG